MHVTRLARIAAVTAAAITVTGVWAAPKAEAAVPGVSTYICGIRGCVRIDNWNCTITTHRNPGNPIDLVRNKCGTRVWLHEATSGTPRTFCVSPNTSRWFYGAWEVGDLQVSSNHNPCP